MTDDKTKLKRILHELDYITNKVRLVDSQGKNVSIDVINLKYKEEFIDFVIKVMEVDGIEAIEVKSITGHYRPTWVCGKCENEFGKYEDIPDLCSKCNTRPILLTYEML